MFVNKYATDQPDYQKSIDKQGKGDRYAYINV